MPFYDYVCESCGHKLEAHQSIKAEPLILCPNCHNEKLKRQIGKPAIIFKGTGWTPKSDSDRAYDQYRL